MKYFYDMHIHSDLSPCANEDMTPNNIVNMSYLKGLSIISVTDHNTCENLPAIKVLCEKTDLVFVPGIEVTTKEEVHVLCYFKNIDYAMQFGKVIYDSLPNIKNIPSIFGMQNIYNSQDEIIGSLDKLLINASAYSLKEINFMVKSYQGIMVPAHVNKTSNSLFGILGFIPSDIQICFVEVYSKLSINEKLIKNLKVLHNSDAHNLVDISEAENFFVLNSKEEVFDILLEEK